MIRRGFLALFAGLSASVVACSTVPAVTPSAQSTSTPAATAGASANAGSVIVLEPDAAAMQASFTVREQLASKPLPSDAIGTTKAVTGKITIHPDGTFVADQSKISVDLTSLKTDQPRRDNFIKQNTLHVDQYPTATFVPTEAKGLPSPIPESGPLKFQLVGDLTVHGVTKPVTWDVNSTLNGKDIKGTATTNLKFEDFGMTPPKVAIVLSVVDNIKLDLNFHLSPAAGA